MIEIFILKYFFSSIFVKLFKGVFCYNLIIFSCQFSWNLPSKYLSQKLATPYNLLIEKKKSDYVCDIVWKEYLKQFFKTI